MEEHKVTHIQAVGSLLLQWLSRLDLIDGVLGCVAHKLDIFCLGASSAEDAVKVVARNGIVARVKGHKRR